MAQWTRTHITARVGERAGHALDSGHDPDLGPAVCERISLCC